MGGRIQVIWTTIIIRGWLRGKRIIFVRKQLERILQHFRRNLIRLRYDHLLFMLSRGRWGMGVGAPRLIYGISSIIVWIIWIKGIARLCIHQGIRFAEARMKTTVELRCWAARADRRNRPFFCDVGIFCIIEYWFCFGLCCGVCKYGSREW